MKRERERSKKRMMWEIYNNYTKERKLFLIFCLFLVILFIFVIIFKGRRRGRSAPIYVGVTRN